MRKALRIRIVGGSLGGLFAAVLLRAQGHEVRIYERSATGLAGCGAGLVAQQGLFAILRAIGCEHVAHVGVVAHEHITFARDGTIAQRQATPQMQISWDNLFRTVRGRLPDEDYVTGRSVVSVSPEGSTVALALDDGTRDSADLVIGADGVGSLIREALVGGPASSRYAGYVAWRGLVPEDDVPADAAAQLFDRFCFNMMPDSHVLGYTVTGPNSETQRGQRRYNWVWYRRTPGEDLGKALTDANGHAHEFSLAPGQVSASRRQALVDDAVVLLPPPFATAVAAEQRPFIQAIFDYETPRMANGRLALPGDAAFVVRPHTAMGVAKAAGDAMALSSALSKLPLEEALKAYERERLPAGAEIAAYGRRLAERFV